MTASKIADYFRSTASNTYNGFELSLFDCDFRTFTNGKYSKQHGMKLAELLTIENIQELKPTI